MRGRRSGIPWLLLALLSIALTLAMTAPISVLPVWRDSPVSIVDASGTWWRGQGWLALRDPAGNQGIDSRDFRIVVPVVWRIGWNDRPVIHIDTPSGQGTVEPDRLGFVADLPGIGFSLEKLPLSGPLKPMGIAGRGQLRSGRLECTYRGICSGKLQLSASGVALRMFAGEILGDVDVAVELRGRVVMADLKIVRPLAVQGALGLEASPGAVSIKGVLRAAETASPQLRAAIATLGGPHPEGVGIDMRAGS